MKLKSSLTLTFVSGLLLASSAHATEYTLSLTNGGAMPVSPGVFYEIEGARGLSEIATPASVGFTELCQTGNPATRLQELKKDRRVHFAVMTSGPILPGKSTRIRFKKYYGRGDVSFHFEAMYGKSKDACSVINLGKEAVEAAAKQTLIAVDQVVSTGKFMDPVLPANADAQLCAAAPSAVDCLRSLSEAQANSQGIRFFPGYLPNVTSFLVDRYGAADALTLQIPTSGAVSYALSCD